MTAITFENIKRKLGFDPFVKDDIAVDPCKVIDNKPDPYSVLTREELHFLNNLIYQKYKSGEIEPVKWT